MVHEDKSEAPGAMSAPPTRLQSNPAEPGTMLSATTGQSQRGHNEQQGDTSAPLYHNEGAINMANSMLCATTMPRISFTEVMPQESADDMLFSPQSQRGHNEQQGDTSAPLYHNEGAINMASMLCATTMPRNSFTEVPPHESADDMLFSPLM
jgi:hypothetical protein